MLRQVALGSSLAVAVLLAGCAGERPESKSRDISAEEARSIIDRALPRYVTDRVGWNEDIAAAFGQLKISPTRDNICAVVAVIEQESGFRVDPIVPNLPSVAWREIDKRADHAGIPVPMVHAVLQLKSSSGKSYGERIDGARTEKDLSDIYEDFIGSVPLGRTLFASKNPIRTRGPMQVNVAFAEQFSAAQKYPYPVKSSMDHELFTRRGSLYFGTAHLLAYPTDYDRYLYRFADYNAGQYASRNAAFQRALGTASGLPLTPDGALLPHDDTAGGATLRAAQSVGKRLGLGATEVRGALEQGKGGAFGRSRLYREVFALAEAKTGRALSRQAVPQIRLEGPKISRALTTEWYANRVDERFRGCLSREPAASAFSQ